MPPGETRVLVCVGPRCDAEGRGRALLTQIRTALEQRHAGALADGSLKLTTRDCLRLCTRDPVVRLEPSGDAFSHSEPQETLRDLLAALAPEK